MDLITVRFVSEPKRDEALAALQKLFSNQPLSSDIRQALRVIGKPRQLNCRFTPGIALALVCQDAELTLSEKGLYSSPLELGGKEWLPRRLSFQVSAIARHRAHHQLQADLKRLGIRKIGPSLTNLLMLNFPPQAPFDIDSLSNLNPNINFEPIDLAAIL